MNPSKGKIPASLKPIKFGQLKPTSKWAIPFPSDGPLTHMSGKLLFVQRCYVATLVLYCFIEEILNRQNAHDRSAIGLVFYLSGGFLFFLKKKTRVESIFLEVGAQEPANHI